MIRQLQGTSSKDDSDHNSAWVIGESPFLATCVDAYCLFFPPWPKVRRSRRVDWGGATFPDSRLMKLTAGADKKDALVEGCGLRG
jgi:hypothetical protein